MIAINTVMRSVYDRITDPAVFPVPKKYRTDNIVSLLQSCLMPKKEITMAFLFGSAARNQLRDNSDIDIAVYLSKYQKETYINRLWQEIEVVLEHPIDLIVLNRDNPTIAWEALQGIPIIKRNYALYLEYMLQTSREAEDFQDFLIDFWKLKKTLRR